jgi:hypothetical protein
MSKSRLYFFKTDAAATEPTVDVLAIMEPARISSYGMLAHQADFIWEVEDGRILWHKNRYGSHGIVNAPPEVTAPFFAAITRFTSETAVLIRTVTTEGYSVPDASLPAPQPGLLGSGESH